MANLVAELIDVDRIGIDIELGSKKRALELLSEMLASAQPNLTVEEVFSCLVHRERLGSTGVGDGMALPHGRLQGLDQAVGAAIRLVDGVDFDARDGQPVDLLFAMLVPEEPTQDHLDTLGELTSMFADPAFCTQMHDAQSPEELFSLLTGDEIAGERNRSKENSRERHQ